MEKIYFDDSTFIWKSKLNLIEYKDIMLNQAKYVIETSKESSKKTDAYGYKHNDNKIDSSGDLLIDNILDKVCQFGIDSCKKIFEEDFKSPFNKVNTDAWINVIRSVNPVQPHFKYEDKYHTHTEIQKETGSFYPHYTYVYYIQMPDIMEGEDGVLYVKGNNKKEYWLRPEEDDLIILPGDLPHAINNAPKSTIDRIVMAGNVGFEYIKQQKSLL